MSALSGPRNTSKLGPGEVVLSQIDVPLKAGTKAYQGGIVCIDSTGYGVKGQAADGLIACGVLEPQQSATPVLDNTSGNSGDIVARVAQGVFRFANNDSIAQVDVGQVAYIVDDQTVAKSDNGGARSPAGIIMAVDSIGVFVSIALQLSKALQTGLTAGAPLESGVTSGALAVDKRSSTLAVTGTVAYTLADGVFVGQRKTITADSAASTPHGVVTPAHGNGWTQADFTTARGSLELEWTAAGWRIVFVGGTVVIT